MKSPKEKQSAVMVKGAVIGCLELLEEQKDSKWKVRCVKCGAESIRPTSTLCWIIKHNTSSCRECFAYKPLQRIGTMILIERLPKEQQTKKTIRWKVRCEKCGKEHILSEVQLSIWKKNPPTGCKNCLPNTRAMPRKYSVGQIVGNCYELTKHIGNGRWMTKCTKCGKEQEQAISNILKHKKETCYYCEYPEGHTSNSIHRNHYIDFKDRYYNYYSSRVKKNNESGHRKYKEWNLDKETFWKLSQGKCHYCGAEPNEFNAWNRKSNRKTVDEVVLLNGIDRIDSDKGYTPDNCVSCCFTCNTMKSTLPQNVFLDCVDRIYKHRHSETIEKQ